MRCIRLRGGDHERLGEIAAVAEGPAAVALSRGGARKTYAHRHPNEDAVGVALGPGGGLAAVADGHAGRDAAALALDHVLEHLAPRWLADDAPDLRARFRDESVGAARELNAAVVRAGLGTPRSPNRTTLSVALVRPGGGWLGYWAVGDSQVFAADAGGVRELDRAADPVVYLGDPSLGPEQLGDAVRCGTAEVGATRCLLLATDGLSEAGIGVADPCASIADVLAESEALPADRRPLELARTVVARALAAQRQQRAGDNVACAVLWLDTLPSGC